MFISSKISLLILPLLASILLLTTGKLKVAKPIENIVFNIFSPITSPASKARYFLYTKYTSIKDLGLLEKQNKQHKNEIARLLTENEFLKQTISDKKVLEKIGHQYREIVPVRITSAGEKYIASSNSSIDSVKPGQPLVSNNILLGTVSEIKGKAITIVPLDHEKTPIFPVRTSTGQKGFYKYQTTEPIITDIPSQYPLVLGDYIFSESNETFPGNLIIGKIKKVMTVSQEPLQKAEIDLYDNLSSNSNNLFIITKP